MPNYLSIKSGLCIDSANVHVDGFVVVGGVFVVAGGCESEVGGGCYDRYVWWAGECMGVGWARTYGFDVGGVNGCGMGGSVWTWHGRVWA